MDQPLVQVALHLIRRLASTKIGRVLYWQAVHALVSVVRFGRVRVHRALLNAQALTETFERMRRRHLRFHCFV